MANKEINDNLAYALRQSFALPPKVHEDGTYEWPAWLHDYQDAIEALQTLYNIAELRRETTSEELRTVLDSQAHTVGKRLGAALQVCHLRNGVR